MKRKNVEKQSFSRLTSELKMWSKTEKLLPSMLKSSQAVILIQVVLHLNFIPFAKGITQYDDLGIET